VGHHPEPTPPLCSGAGFDLVGFSIVPRCLCLFFPTFPAFSKPGDFSFLYFEPTGRLRPIFPSALPSKATPGPPLCLRKLTWWVRCGKDFSLIRKRNFFFFLTSLVFHCQNQWACSSTPGLFCRSSVFTSPQSPVGATPKDGRLNCTV